MSNRKKTVASADTKKSVEAKKASKPSKTQVAQEEQEVVALPNEVETTETQEEQEVVDVSEEVETENNSDENTNEVVGYVVPDVYELAGVDKGEYPFQLLLNNHTPTSLSFPELGEQEANSLPAHAENIPVVFSSENMVHQFTNNLKQLGELLQWNEHFGVFIKKGS